PMPGGAAATTTVVASVDVAAQGAKLCGEIEGCLKEGQLSQARKLANAMLEGPYGLKVKANEYLVKVDAEEARLAIADSEKHFELFVRAMNRKDFDVARSYAEKVDKRRLDAGKGKQFNEMLASPEYQRHLAGNDVLKPGSFVEQGVRQAVAQDGPAKGSSLVEELKNKHNIEYQRLRTLTNAT